MMMVVVLVYIGNKTVLHLEKKKKGVLQALIIPVQRKLQTFPMEQKFDLQGLEELLSCIAFKKWKKLVKYLGRNYQFKY